MNETSIKYNCTRWLERKGWIPFRLRSADGSGWPDNFYIRRGVCIFIEYKTPNGKLSAIQHKRLDQIRAQGFEAWVVDGIDSLISQYHYDN